MPSMTIRLSEALQRQLARESARIRQPRSEVVRTAIAAYLAQTRKDRLMAAIVAEMRATQDDPASQRESVQMAEEALPLDNEALRVAEDAPGDQWWK